MSSETITRNDLKAILNSVLPSPSFTDFFYPVGSYYETSDSSFDPEEVWGGTWSSETVFDGGVMLFDNPSQSAAGAITLSDSASNYDKLDLLFLTTGGNRSSTSVYDPNNKKVVLWSAEITDSAASNRTIYAKFKCVKIDGTTINTNYRTVSGTNIYHTGQQNIYGSNYVTVTDYISIIQVIGYKKITCWHRIA